MNLKPTNKPSNDFYNDMYIVLNEFMKKNKYLSKLDINVSNIVGIRENIGITADTPHMGYMHYQLNSTDIMYSIDIMENMSLDFFPKELLIFSVKNYGIYMSILNIPFTPETVTMIVLMHEIGHIVYMELLKEYCEDNRTLKYFLDANDNLSVCTFKPWDVASMTLMRS
jgi:hypothetical protein